MTSSVTSFRLETKITKYGIIKSVLDRISSSMAHFAQIANAHPMNQFLFRNIRQFEREVTVNTNFGVKNTSLRVCLSHLCRGHGAKSCFVIADAELSSSSSLE